MNSTTELNLNICNTSEDILPQQSLAVLSSSSASVLLLSVLFGLTAVLGFVGNALTLLAFVTERKLLRKNFNLLLINLTVADLFVSVFDLPFQVIYNQLGYWPFGVVECALLIFVDWGMTFVSIFTLVAISIDRYWAACYAQSYKIHNTRKRTLICIAFVWAVLLILWTPVYLVDRIGAGTRHPESCSVSLSDRRPYTICLMVAGYHLPTILMIFCYVRVCRVVRRDQRIIACANETESRTVDDGAESSVAKGDFQVQLESRTVSAAVTQPKTRWQKKLFLSLSYLLAAYLVLWTPIQIAVDIMCFSDSLVSADLYGYTCALSYFNSALNPFLYAASSVQTREALRKVLCRFRR